MSRRKMMPLALFLMGLFGCSTGPQKVTCPTIQAPPVLMLPSQSLDRLPDKPKLSDIARTVTINYGKYHELAEQMKSLQEWAEELNADR